MIYVIKCLPESLIKVADTAMQRRKILNILDIDDLLINNSKIKLIRLLMNQHMH